MSELPRSLPGIFPALGLSTFDSRKVANADGSLNFEILRWPSSAPLSFEVYLTTTTKEVASFEGADALADRIQVSLWDPEGYTALNIYTFSITQDGLPSAIPPGDWLLWVRALSGAELVADLKFAVWAGATPWNPEPDSLDSL